VSVPSITPAEVAAKIADGWTIVDVREDDEWAAGHVDGAVHIPLPELVERLAEIPDPAVCMCHVGGRSAMATAYLTAQGRQAVNLDGGIVDWVAAGLPTVR